MKKAFKILVVLLLTVFCLGFCVNMRYAFAEPSSIEDAVPVVRKALAYGVYNCYINNKINKTVEIEDIRSASDLVNGRDKIVRMFGPLFGDEMNAKLSCEEFFGGAKNKRIKWGTVGKTLLKLYIPVYGLVNAARNVVEGESIDDFSWVGLIENNFTDLSAKQKLLEDMGYSKKEDKRKVAFKYSIRKAGGNTVDSYSVGDLIVGGGVNDVTWVKNERYTKQYIKIEKNKTKITVTLIGSLGPDMGGETFSYPVEINISGGVKVDESFDVGKFIAEEICESGENSGLLRFSCSKESGNVKSLSFAVDVVTSDELQFLENPDGNQFYSSAACSEGSQCSLYYYNLVDIDTSALREELVGAKWQLGAADTSAFKFVHNTFEDMPLTQGVSTYALNYYEESILYNMYLDGYYKADYECEGGNFDFTSLTNVSNKVKLIQDKEGKKCAVFCRENCDKKVNGLDGNNFFNAEVGFDVVAEGADTSKIPQYDPEKYKETEDENKTPATITDGENSCYGGAKSLGWIICPAMDFLASQTSTIYEDFVEPYLSVKASLFTDENGSAANAYEAWGVFRNIANILFGLLLLFIIFSQLTGYGIDNYGIKKILPKLIIAAILINLSYIICELAVDLSNIMGSSFNSFFDGIFSADTLKDLTIEETKIQGGGGLATGISAVALIITMSTMVLSVYANPAIILPVLIGLIGVFIGIIFFFFILAARQVAIVCYVVVSPIAFACMMLPNTKRFFDKWWKVGWGLLLVYPICGLLMGGGNFVSRLILNAGTYSKTNSVEFVTAFVAMAASIAPIFFIPEVVSNAMNALPNVLGGLANKISGLGKGISRSTQGAIRGSEGYKTLQKAGYNRKIRIQAGYNKDWKPTALGKGKAMLANTKFGKAIGFQGLQAAKVAAAGKNKEDIISAGAALNDMSTKYDLNANPTMNTSQMLIDRLKKIDAKDEVGFLSVVEQMKNSNMKHTDICDATREAFNTKGMSKTFKEEFAKRYGSGFLKKDYEQFDYLKKGGIDKNTSALVSLGNAGDWARRGNLGIDDLKDEDVAAVSTSNLYALIKAGVVSQPQAQRVWASNSNMDDTNRLMLGAYGNDLMNAGNLLTKQQIQAELTNPHIFTREQIRAFTERSAEGVVINDVNIRNSTNGTKNQTDVLRVSHAPNSGGKRGRNKRNP